MTTRNRPIDLSHSRHTRKALALSLGPAVALGLARFGYAILLPAMQRDLAWTYTQAGSMNTANALGYLAGALIAAPVTARLGVRRAFRDGFLVTALSVLASGITNHFMLLLVLRLLAGLGGAVTFIGGATLAAHLANSPETRSGTVLGLYFGGVGLGIFVLGLGVPLLLDTYAWTWQPAWIGMGLLSLLAFRLAARVARSLESISHEEETTMPVFRLPLLGLLLSGLFFGIAFLSVVSAVTDLVRRGLPPSAWAGGIALFTILFAVGQTLGPLVSGALADLTGGLNEGFALSTGLLFLGTLFSAFQPEVTRSTDPIPVLQEQSDALPTDAGDL